jgi:hypothetical protein
MATLKLDHERNRQQRKLVIGDGHCNVLLAQSP